VNKHEADRLIAVIRELAEEDIAPLKLTAPPAAPKNGRIVLDPKPAAPVSDKALAADIAGGHSILGHYPPASITAEQMEKMYQQFKARLLDELPTDPVALQLLTTRPEIVLEIEPRVVTLNGGMLKGRVARLIASGWFASVRATSACRRELARTGADPGGGGNLSAMLSELKREGFLVESGGSWVAAPNIKITERTIEAHHADH
jgi:hypothetical protein